VGRPAPSEPTDVTEVTALECQTANDEGYRPEEGGRPGRHAERNGPSGMCRVEEGGGGRAGGRGRSAVLSAGGNERGGVCVGCWSLGSR